MARTCVFDECIWNTQVLKEDGTCQTCGVFTKPDGLEENNRICVFGNCSIGEILKEDASCMECPAWTHPDSEARVCIKDPCNYEVEKLTVTGTCETCPEYYHPTPLDEEGDSKGCMQDSCTERQAQRIDGTCADCPNFSYPGPEKRACVTDECGFAQYLLVTGTCAQCPLYSHQDYGNVTECSTDACGGTEKFALNGTCEGCPERTYANTEGTACVKALSPGFNETLGQLFEQGTLMERLGLFEQDAIGSEAYNYTVKKIFLYLNESYDFSGDRKQASYQLAEDWDTFLRTGLTESQSLSIAHYFEELLQEEEFQTAFARFAAYREGLEEGLYELGLQDDYLELLDKYETHKARAWTTEELEAVWANIWAEPLVKAAVTRSVEVLNSGNRTILEAEVEEELQKQFSDLVLAVDDYRESATSVTWVKIVLITAADFEFDIANLWAQMGFEDLSRVDIVEQSKNVTDAGGAVQTELGDASPLADEFAVLDSDGDGTISLEEMQAIQENAPAGQPESLAIILEAADTDSSGGIDYREFVAFSGQGFRRVQYTICYTITSYSEETAVLFEKRQLEYFVQNEADLGAEIDSVETKSFGDALPRRIIEDGQVVAEGYEGIEITSGRQFTDISITLEIPDLSYQLDLGDIAAQMGVECQVCFTIGRVTDLENNVSSNSPVYRLVEYRIVLLDRKSVTEYEQKTIVYFATDRADLGAKIRRVGIESPTGGSAQIIEDGIVIFEGYEQIDLTSGAIVIEVAALLQVPDRSYAFDIQAVIVQMASECGSCFDFSGEIKQDSANPDGSYNHTVTFSITSIDRASADEYQFLTVEYFARDAADLGAVILDLSITDYEGETREVIRDSEVVAEGYPAVRLSSGRKVVTVSLVLKVDDQSYVFEASEVAVQMEDECLACYSLLEAVLGDEINEDGSRYMTVGYGIYSPDTERANQRGNQTILFFVTDQADFGAVIVNVTLTPLEEGVVQIAEDGRIVYPGYEGTRLSAGQFETTLELSLLVESNDSVLEGELMGRIASQLRLQNCSSCLVVTNTTFSTAVGEGELIEMNVTYTYTQKRGTEAEQYVSAAVFFYAANIADLGHQIANVRIIDNWGNSAELVSEGVSAYGEYAGTAITSGDYAFLVTIVLQVDPEESFELDFDLIPAQMGLDTTASLISLEETSLSGEITGPRSTSDLTVTYSIRSRYRVDSHEAEELTVLYYATDQADLGGPLWSVSLVESSGTPVAIVTNGLVVYEDYLGTVLTKGKETTAALFANLVLLADAQVPNDLKSDVAATLGEAEVYQSNGLIFKFFAQLASTEGSSEMRVDDLLHQNYGSGVNEDLIPVLESIQSFYMYEELMRRNLTMPDALYLLEALRQQDGAYAAIISLIERRQDEPRISQILQELQDIVEAADTRVGELQEALSAKPTCRQLAAELSMLANSEYGTFLAVLGGLPRVRRTSLGFEIIYETDFAEFRANNSAAWHETYVADLLDIPSSAVSVLDVSEGSTIVGYLLEAPDPMDSDKSVEQLQDELVALLVFGEFQPGPPILGAAVRDQTGTVHEREIVIMRDGSITEEAASYVNASLAQTSILSEVAASLEVQELAEKVEAIYTTSS